MPTNPNQRLVHTPKSAVAMFKKVLKEAAAFYEMDPSNITLSQFTYVGQGRLGRTWIERLGGYSALRNFACSKKNPGGLDKKTIDMLKKMLVA
jgi:hypothetical protein